MNEIKDYFNKISLTQTSESLAERVMSASRQPARKLSLRPLTAAAAAVAVLAVGVTGAAATGLLDFNTIFGGFMMTEDEKLAETLLSCAQNVEWSVSDEDYEIVLKGVTGSQNDMLVNYEIVRTDGKPVKDFFTNLPQSDRLDSIATDFSDTERYLSAKEAGEDIKQRSSTAITINEDGNIEIFGRMISDSDITGSRQSSECYNIYPHEALQSFLYTNGVLSVIDENGAFFSHGTESGSFIRSDISVTDERIIGLSLEWKLAFDYYPTEAALSSKCISDMSQPVILRQRYGTQGLKQAEYTIFDSSFTSVGGRLMIQQPDTTAKIDEQPSLANEYMDTFLITSDGKQIEVSLGYMGSYYEKQDEDIDMYCIDVRYSTDKISEITVVNVDDITAISINGTVFPIE